MQSYTRSADNAISHIPEGYQLQLTDAVAEYARNMWTNAVARRLGKYPLAIFPIPESISGDLAEEVNLLAESLADALFLECKSCLLFISRHS
jgi:hypothetical protein